MASALLTLRAMLVASLILVSGISLAIAAQDPSVHHASQAALDEWKDIGPAKDSDILNFLIYLKSGDEEGLDSKMDEIVQSNGQQKWLTFDELKAYVQPKPEVKTLIKETLKDGGAKKISFDALGNTVAVQARVDGASKMLNTKFRLFTKKGQDKPLVRAYNYTIPPALLPHVIGLTPLLNFQEKPKRSGESLAARGHPALPMEDSADTWTSTRDLMYARSSGLLPREVAANQSGPQACHHAATPACLRQLYGVDEFQGKPDDPSIALVLFGPEGTNQKDVELFMNKYRPGVPYDLKLAYGEGLENTPPAEGEFAELTLDIQTAAGIASPIPLRGYVLPASDNTDIAFTSFFDYFINLPDSERPGVASYSFGTEESTEATSSLRIGCQSAKHLTALGTTIFVASGDWGVFGSVKGGSPGITCPPFLPTWPSGCPYVVSVGATAGLQDETAVDEKQHDFWGGGGFSNVFPTPDYQKQAVDSYIESLDGAENGNYNATGRAYPDISAIGYMVPTIHAGRLGAQLGTSASSPSAAAVFALLNSARKAAGLGTIGWANPTLYKHPELFVDVTKGKAGGCTDEEGTEHSLPTRPGWDAATGWGSLRFDKLRTAFGVEADTTEQKVTEEKATEQASAKEDPAEQTAETTIETPPS